MAIKCPCKDCISLAICINNKTFLVMVRECEDINIWLTKSHSGGMWKLYDDRFKEYCEIMEIEMVFRGGKRFALKQRRIEMSAALNPTTIGD